jgi:DNA-binding PadR family transcriptional regulator
MEDKPVYLGILFLLGFHAQNSKTGLNVNTIYKKLVKEKTISKYKKSLIDALKYLETAKLIQPTLSGKQKKIMSLTPLGHEFVKLVPDIDKYVKSCSELEELIKHLVDIGNQNDKKVQRSILRNDGWTNEEIDESERIIESAEQLGLLISPNQIITVLLNRYISILSKINDNESAKTILYQIMMEKIIDLISKTAAKVTETDSYRVLTYEKNYFCGGYYYYNRITDSKVSIMLKSLSDALDSERPLREIIHWLDDPNKDTRRRTFMDTQPVIECTNFYKVKLRADDLEL